MDGLIGYNHQAGALTGFLGVWAPPELFKRPIIRPERLDYAVDFQHS